MGATTTASRAGLLEAVHAELDKIVDPCSASSVTPMSLVEMGLIKHVELSADGVVDVQLRVSVPTCLMVGYMTKEAVRRVSELPGVTEVRVEADDGMEWEPDMIAPAAAERRRERLALLVASGR